MLRRSTKTPALPFARWLTLLLPAALLLLFAGWLRAEETSTPVSDFLVEFPIPSENGGPLNIVAEAPGHLWFTMPEANAIGSLVVTSTVDYQFELFDVPTSESYPYDLVYDFSRGGVWFTEHEANQIAFLNTATGAFTETLITTAASAPTGIALSPDGTIWFVERDANQLAKFTPDSGTLDEFEYDKPGGLLEDVVVMDPDSIWFSAPGVKYVSKFKPSNEHFTPVTVNSGPGTPSFAADQLVVGSTGHLWASAPDVDRIGLFVPGTSQLWRWYSLPETGAGIAGLAYSWENGNHNLWYTAGDKGLVGTLVISAAGNLTEVRRHALSSPDSMPIGIAVDSNETAWIAEFAAVKIASWVPPYTRPSFVPLIQS